MDDDFDASSYLRLLKLDVPGALALSIALLGAVPPGAPRPVATAARELRKKAVALRAAWRVRDRAERHRDPRPVDILADAAMERLYRRMEEYAGLPYEQHPLALRAEDLLHRLFPSRLSFLSGEFTSQWAVTQTLLDIIDNEKLGPDIDRISGPEFLAEVRRLHEIYGEAIGVSRPSESLRVPSLSAPVREVCGAVVRYAAQLVSTLLDVEADLETRQAARMALAPIDVLRAGRRLPAVTAEAEVPEVA